MTTPDETTVLITFRIPGNWAHPGELIERMPEGYCLTSEFLVMPDGQRVELTPNPPDGQFVEIFRSSCRTPMTESERRVLTSYTVNFILSGPGGSLQNAHTMMKAASAIIRAGGAGVFIDNSALAHAGHTWLDLTDSGDSDALSFAFVSVVDGAKRIYTVGMHVLGLPDLEMEQTCGTSDDVIEMLRYVCGSEKPVGDGHIIVGENGPRFHVFARPESKERDCSPMSNPFGRLQLRSVRRLAAEN